MKMFNPDSQIWRSGARLAVLTCAAAFSFSGPIAGAADLQTLTGHVPAVVAQLQPVDRLDPTTNLTLAIVLPLRNREELTNTLRDIYDPSSPYFHHYLAPGDFADRFGPAASDYAAVTAFAAANHLSVVGTHPNRTILDVRGSVADIESALHTHLRVYRHPTENRTFFAPDVEPSLDLQTPVLHISGLDNFSPPRPLLVKKPFDLSGTASPDLGSGPGGTYLGNDFRSAYVPGVTLSGNGQSVGLFELDGYFPSDISEYESVAGLPNVTLQNVFLDGFNGIPGFANDEVALDIDMSICMAPGLSKVIVYEGFIPLDILNRMATDDSASQLSSSWGWFPLQAGTEQVFLQFAAQGQSFFQASGDDDAYTGFVFAPSDDPNITIVGGTTLSTSGPGGNWVSEKVWNWDIEYGPIADGIGSSGGISPTYPIPSWQQGVSMANNGGSTTMRNLPDVALTADNVFIFAFDGFQEDIGGTSCAAPLWAGFTALVNERALENGLSTVGFLNPALYAIGKGVNYNADFHDITSGNNFWSGSPTEFPAVPGYDLCTGWGTPNGPNMIAALAPGSGAPAPILSVTTNYVFGGNGNGLIDPDECNTLQLVLTNSGLVGATNVQATLSTTNANIIISERTANFPDIPTNTAVTNLTAFQISTLPQFVCGTPIQFTLVIKCDEALLTTHFTVNTGTAGAASWLIGPGASFSGNNSAGGTSSIVVSNVASAAYHVAVGVRISDFFAAGLSLQLVGPDGTTVILSQNNGGDGSDYGTAATCDETNASGLTIFDDNASASISAGNAPFLGSYKPQQPLAAYIGKSGTNLNGTWQLQVADAISGDSGSIDCWSLFLTPAACLDGGGECPGADLGVAISAAGNSVVAGTPLTYTITATNAGPDTATNVALNQTFSPSVIIQSAQPSQGNATISGGAVSASLGTMPAASGASMTVVVIPPTPGDLFSGASIGSTQPDPNPLNNSAGVTVRVIPPTADLSIGLNATPNPALLGGEITYSIGITNNGPSLASPVLVTNVLPAGVSFVTGAPSQGSITDNGSTVVWSAGSLNAGANAAATVVCGISPTIAVGEITDTATVWSPEVDPLPANNTAVLQTAVGPAADLAITMAGSPFAAIYGSNITYTLTVQNLGPSGATNVNLTDTMPGDGKFVSSNPGTGVSVNGQLVLWSLGGGLPAGASTNLVIVIGTSNVPPASLPASLTNNAVVSSSVTDPNLANNSASLVTVVNFPTNEIVAAGARLVTQTTDGAIDPGATVTVKLGLQNIGNITGGSVVATLLATNGVTSPSGPQTYGVLQPGSTPVFTNFTFTASGTNGGVIDATLQLVAGGSNIPPAVFVFQIPQKSVYYNASNIAIPASSYVVGAGPGSLYPSTINVSGFTNVVGKVTVTITNFSHTYASDVAMLLVGPGGQSVVLMSDAGQGSGASGASLTFDDGAASELPEFSQITSGTYQTSPYAGWTTNVPSGPTGSTLSGFIGSSPNGAWSLYVYDDSQGDTGNIIGGWSLNLVTGQPINEAVDLALSGGASPSPVLAGSQLTYTYTILNNGPGVASSGASFTNPIPAGETLASLPTSTLGTAGTNVSGVIFCVLTNSLAVGASATVTEVVNVAPGFTSLSSQATLTDTNTANTDITTSDKSVTVVTPVTTPSAGLTLALADASPSAVVGSNMTFQVAVTNLGPQTAYGVVVTNPLPHGVAFNLGLSSSTVGTVVTNAGIASCALGTLPVGSGALVTLAEAPLQSGSLTNIVGVSTLSANTNPVTLVTNVVVVSNSAPIIVAGGATMIVSGNAPLNRALVPGVAVTVAFTLTNAGTADTTNLVATLLSANGVGSISGNPQTYGRVHAAGAAVSENFTFTPSGANGGLVTAVLQLTNDVTNSVAFAFNLPATNAYTNNAAIVIPDHGQGSPYPSAITITNAPGLVTKATVTLAGFTHSWPSDVGVLLVSPSGQQSTELMAVDGGPYAVTNATFTFDDAAAAMLPANSQMTGGTYLPSGYNLDFPFQNPAPAGPYSNALAVFEGTAPNGTWLLYVYDDVVGNSGNIASGWTLNLATASPVSAVADLGVAIANPGTAIFTNVSFAYTITIANNGPSAATDVILTTVLPAGMTFHGTVPGGALQNGSTVILNAGSLAAGTATNVTLTASAAASGIYATAVSVSADQADFYQPNNSATVNTSVSSMIPPSLTGAASGKGRTFTFTLNGQPGQIYSILSSTDLVHWAAVTNTPSPFNGKFTFTDSNVVSSPRRFYRAALVP
jgi:uncharacterized repeat protein (TIGR01451 family)